MAATKKMMKKPLSARFLSASPPMFTKGVPEVTSNRCAFYHFLHKSFIFLYEVLKDKKKRLEYNKSIDRRDLSWSNIDLLM